MFIAHRLASRTNGTELTNHRPEGNLSSQGNVVLILFVPWPTKWIPAVVIIPIGIADLYAMLAILSVVGKFVQTPKASVRS